MAITKKKKEEIVAMVADAIHSAASAVFVNFHGITVGDTMVLRKQLRENDVRYTVVKKTLIKRALSGEKISGSLPALEGEIAIAYGDDLLTPAREIYEFQKIHKDTIRIVGGVFERSYKNPAEMMEIASIPPIEVLYGQFANVVNSPIQGLAVALGAIAEKKSAGA